jgi:hypothetical protein
LKGINAGVSGAYNVGTAGVKFFSDLGKPTAGKLAALLKNPVCSEGHHKSGSQIFRPSQPPYLGSVATIAQEIDWRVQNHRQRT